MKYALILPVLLLDILLVLVSLPTAGILYLIMVEDDRAPFILKLLKDKK